MRLMVNQGGLHIWLPVCIHTLQIVCKNYCNFSLCALAFAIWHCRFSHQEIESILYSVNLGATLGLAQWCASLEPKTQGALIISALSYWALLPCGSEVAQSCVTLCNPMDCSLTGSSICGIFQARVLKWVASSTSRGSSWPGDRTQVSCIAGRRFTLWATREAPWAEEHGRLQSMG